MENKVIHEGKVLIENNQPVKVEVERGMRGNYGWKIRIYGRDKSKVIKRIKEFDKELNREFGGKEQE